jgi:hypothetical protein
VRLASDLYNLESEWYDIFSQEERKIDEDFEKEYAATEEYKEKMDVACVEVEAFLNKLTVQNNNTTTTCSSSTFCRRKLKWPKIELKAFGGDVKDWLSFWSQFSRIHEAMEDEDKFQYLIQATASGTRARELVYSFPPTSENYAKAIDSLKSRFGREELLIEFYVRELLGLMIKSATETKNNVNTAQLYKLESYLRALESIGMTTDKYATMLFPMIESCILEELLRVWLRIPAVANIVEPQNNAYSDKLKQLLSFFRNEVEREERISLAKAGFKLTEGSMRKDKKKPSTEGSVATASDLFSGERNVGKQLC